MSNILIIYEVKDNTTDNNISSLTTVLSQMNTDSRVVKSSNVSVNDINWCDVCIANRPNSPYSVSVVRAVKSVGGYVVVSLDDDIIHLPSEHPSYWKSKYTLLCLEIGDALLSPNPLLLNDYCEKYHLRPVLSTAFVRTEDIKPIHSLRNKIRIVYPAGKDHLALFDKYIQPFFKDFVKEFSDKVEFTFIGIEPSVKESESVHLVKGMPYKDYLNYMNTQDFDVGIAPLDEDSFCARKYFAKYIEYCKYGILGIYSDVKPYTFAVNDGYNGLLVSGGAEQWKEVLLRIINNPETISELVRNSRNDIRKRYSLNNAILKLRQGCPELEIHQGRNKFIKRYRLNFISIIHYNSKDFITRFIFHLKYDGLNYFIKNI